MQEGQLELELPGYHQYWNYAQKKGYSGTAIFAKEEPLSVSYGIGIQEHDTEGRVITLEYDNFYLKSNQKYELNFSLLSFSHYIVLDINLHV